MKNFFTENKWFLLILFFGLVSRIYLVFNVPIWKDEVFSIYTGSFPLIDIINSITENGHPPGYYLLVHFIEKISMNLLWIRSLSLLTFVASVYLIKIIGEKYLKFGSPTLLVFLYVFSGYFVIHDWQARMYPLANLLILVSILNVSKIKDSQNSVLLWTQFTIINFLGLYTDYSFVWYFVPMGIFLHIYFILKKEIKKFIYLLISCVMSCLTFVLIDPTVFATYKSGIHTIEWTRGLMDPAIFIPFFLGTVPSVVFTIIFFGLFLYGIYALYFNKNDILNIWIVVFSALVSLVGTYVYSVFFSPIFHIRSLQVVALAILFVYFYGLTSLPAKIKKYALFVFLFYYLCNSFLVHRIIFEFPEAVGIEPFPWKTIFMNTDLVGVKSIKLVEYNEVNLQNMWLGVYGLKYTLAGNEGVGLKPINVAEYDPNSDNSNCILINDPNQGIYKCY